MRFCPVTALFVLALLAAARSADGGNEKALYNGIVLPDQWPPRPAPLTDEPLPLPPYLADPPQVIPIDVGRQLFVDDFLIEETTLARIYHAATYIEGNPVLVPDKPWELEGGHPCAMVFSDGVWFDPADRLYKMWYLGGYCQATCYATSEDGLHWNKPSLDVVPGTNIVHTARRDSGTVWLDLEERDLARRFKMALYELDPPRAGRMTLYVSPDGIHWSDPVTETEPTGDRSTLFYNPFRGMWVYSIRSGGATGRSRQYAEHADPIAGAKWGADGPSWWVGADRLDPPRPDVGTRPELYNLDCVAYESLMLGFFSIWYGQPQDRAKPNEVLLGYSRDGFHWTRPVRTAFAPVSERHGDWNWANVQSAGGGCLVVGDELWFYVSGRAGVPGSSGSGVCATGLAKLRRDGFCSMEAPRGTEGYVTTRPVSFSGKHLFVNAEAAAGALRAEVLDEGGRVIPGFSREKCIALRSDSTRARIEWRGAPDLSSLAGKPVRFRFAVRGARLYSFWVSPDASGASHGYVAAGGPGFTGPTDTVGATSAR